MKATMLQLRLAAFCFILALQIPLSLQCSGGRPPDNSALIREQEKARIQELRIWCHEHCMTEWTPFSPCSSRCGRGEKTRTRVSSNSKWCEGLEGFECNLPKFEKADCISPCINGGFASDNACAGCPVGRSGTCCETEIFCPFPQNPTNGQVNGDWPAKPNTLARFSCNKGFNLVGKSAASCKNDGTWSDGPPRCEAIMCAQPLQNPNVKLLNAQQGYAFEEEVLYSCEDGHALSGPSKRTCKRNAAGQGSWSGFDPECKPVKCPVPVVPLHGRITTQLSTFQYKDIVRFDCDQGYKLIGSDALQCLASGKWFGHQPTCEVIKCEPPFTPRNGQVRIRKSGITEQAFFECDEGYRLQPDVRFLTCTSQGTWSGTEPRCIASSCDDPGSPEHGYRDGGVFTFGNKVTFHCERGYEMKGGSKTIECQSNTQWSGILPTCEACPIGFYLDGQACSKCPANSHTTSNGSTSILQCLCDQDKGYVGPPGGPCEEIFCTRLSAPDNGKISQCGNKVGDSCRISCNDGFVVERGSTQRACQSTGEWDGAHPTCVPCKLNTFKGSDRTCLPCPLHSHTVDSGQMRSGCICDDGYQGPSGGSCTDVNECQANSGKGPCSDSCENNDGGFHCGCNIPGYKLDPQNDLACIPGDQCRNLTKDEAPENGGLVCHWFREENSQHCASKCNPGFEMPDRANDFETCGPATGYQWSYQLVDKNAELTPCIPEFFPNIRLEGESSYFAAACESLNENQKTAAKVEFANRLNAKGVCKRSLTKICDIKDMAIICGRTTRRRKRRGVDVLEHSVDFAYNISALKFEDKTTQCADKICPMLRIPPAYCDRYCKPTYKRYLQAAVMFAKSQLLEIHRDINKLRDLQFNVDNLGFAPEEEGFRSSDVIKECMQGFEAVNDQCVPCKAGSYLNENTKKCVECPQNYYQNQDRQTTCLPCSSIGPGYSTNRTGSTQCQICTEGRWGNNCGNRCNCAHGSCSPFNGQCICPSGWEGRRCEKDINSCVRGSCYPGVTCIDQPPPGTGFSCGPCPAGYHGDGITCTRLRQRRSVGLMAFEL